MHKSLKTIAMAGSAMALAMTGTLAAAQEQMPETAPAPGESTQTTPTETTPRSMPDTTPQAAPESDDGITSDTPDSPATTTAPPATADQDAMMQSWPADRQTGYKAWPAETQTYFWSLNPQRQEIFWALSDSDKVTLSKMPEAQRESTWAQIESRLTPPRG